MGSRDRHAEEGVVEWALLFEVPSELEANMLQGILATAGIPVRMMKEPVAHLYGITEGALGWVKMYVPKERLEEASALLAGDVVDEGFDVE